LNPSLLGTKKGCIKQILSFIEKYKGKNPIGKKNRTIAILDVTLDRIN